MNSLSQKEKQFQKIKNNPRDVSFLELKTLLEYFGFVLTNKTGGSHWSVSYPCALDVFGQDELRPIPSNKNPVKLPYIKCAIGWIEKVK